MEYIIGRTELLRRKDPFVQARSRFDGSSPLTHLGIFGRAFFIWVYSIAFLEPTGEEVLLSSEQLNYEECHWNDPMSKGNRSKYKAKDGRHRNKGNKKMRGCTFT